MSTTPILEPEQPPPPPDIIESEHHSGHGSVGPVIAVLAVITILGVIAVMIGRLCSGRRIMGHGQYDFEGWVETKCSSCINGRVDPPPPGRVGAENTSGNGSGDADPVAVQIETPQEMKEEEISQHNPNERAES